MDSKVIVSLVSVFLGALLALIVTLGREVWTNRKLRIGVMEELGDLQLQIERTLLITQRQLQVHANNGIDPQSFALPLSNLFFKTYFKDVFNKLNREQRNSLQMINATVDSLNEQNEDLIETAQKLRADFSNDPTGFTIEKRNKWEEDLVGFYKSVMVLAWHIEYHQEHLHAPFFRFMSEAHEEYLKYLKEIDDGVASLLENSKGMDQKQFESRAFDLDTVQRHRLKKQRE
jgi:hypothetical protein